MKTVAADCEYKKVEQRPLLAVNNCSCVEASDGVPQELISKQPTDAETRGKWSF